jgi:microsomal dipeptidase-like Zn-dependent dipeptidase
MMTFETNGVLRMAETKDWEDRVKGLLKSELKRRNVTYAQLVEKLAAIGVVDSEPNIRNKLARGKFTAVFLVQCLEAIGSTSLRLD